MVINIEYKTIIQIKYYINAISFPASDALIVNTNWNVTVVYYMFEGIGLNQNFELKILRSTYMSG